MRLNGKIAFVTGAASGIGRATVSLFRQEGAQVVAADLNSEQLAESFAAADGITAVPLDVSDSAAVTAAFRQVEARHGRLDVLVNAAGITGPGSEVDRMAAANERALEAIKRGDAPAFDYLEDTTDDDFRRTMEINLFSQFYTLRSAAPLMKRAGGGSVVNISSVLALVGTAQPLYYPASKAGILGLTRAAAAELAPYQIRVNAIAPGGVDTPMVHQHSEELIQFLQSLQTIKRLGTPEEIAQTILFLADDTTGGFYTGQTLSPSGGTHM